VKRGGKECILEKGGKKSVGGALGLKKEWEEEGVVLQKKKGGQKKYFANVSEEKKT